MRPVAVVVLGVLAEYSFEMSTTEDEHPVQTLAPDSPDETLGQGVGSRRPTGGLRVGPLSTHQLTMPTEQGIGLHEEPSELRSGNQPAEAGKRRSI
jgi:hypothetical protein